MWGEVDEGTVNHYVCGPTSTRVQVLATPTGGSSDATGSVRSSSRTVFSSGGGLPRSSTRQAISSSEDNESSTGSTQTSKATNIDSTTTDDRPRINTAATGVTRNTVTSTQSTAGAMKTAQAVAGAVGGLVGVIALLV